MLAVGNSLFVISTMGYAIILTAKQCSAGEKPAWTDFYPYYKIRKWVKLWLN